MRQKVATLLLAFFVCSCGEQHDDARSHQAIVRHGQVADRPIIFHERIMPSQYSIKIRIEKGNLLVNLSNNDFKPIYVPGDIVSGMSYKEPYLQLLVMNAEGNELGKCGNFEIPPEKYEPIVVSGRNRINISASVEELKEQYCADAFVVQGIISIFSGENRRVVLSRSNRIQVAGKPTKERREKAK